MASVVQICNMALSHIGADARVSSIDPPDGSIEAGHCDTFYDIARTELLEPGNWAFSLHRAALAAQTNPSDFWTFAYALPSDCLRALRLPGGALERTVFSPHGAHGREAVQGDRSSAEFDIEGGLLYCHVPDAVLVYVRDVTDTTAYSPSFTSALSYLLASYIAGPIVKGGEGLRQGDAMRERAMRLADISATASANASFSAHEPLPSSLAARA